MKSVSGDSSLWTSAEGSHALDIVRNLNCCVLLVGLELSGLFILSNQAACKLKHASCYNNTSLENRLEGPCPGE